MVGTGLKLVEKEEVEDEIEIEIGGGEVSQRRSYGKRAYHAVNFC